MPEGIGNRRMGNCNRRRRITRAAAVLLLLTAPLHAADYSPADDPLVNPASLSATPPDDRDAIAHNETIIRHLRADPATLNPILMTSAHELAVKELLFDEPVVYGPNLEWKLNPAMVAGYTESADHTSAELTLKAGLRWHDGHPLTADDVLFSWRMLRDERVPAIRARVGIEGIADCAVANPRTLRFRFAEPLPTNRWRIKFPVIPRHIYNRQRHEDPTLARSDYHVTANRRPVGNGPYRLVEWSRTNRIVLDRWEQYHGKAPFARRVVFRIVPDANAALLMFKRAELDAMSLTPAQFAAQTNDDRFAAVGVKGWAPQATMYCIGWNMDGSNPFFNDRDVRRAMSHALNLPLIINNIYNNLFTRCTGVFPPGSWAHNPEIDPIPYDRDRAAELLEKAGWRIDPHDGWRYKTVKTPGGKTERRRFAFTLLFPQESKTSPKVAAVLQQDLKRIGVDMTPQALEYTTLRGRVFTRAFQAVAWAWTAEAEPDDARNLFHSDARNDGQNFVGYANPRVDALFEKARHTFDRPTRQACYREISRIVYHDAPYTFMINAPSLWAFHKRIHGVHFSPLGPAGFHPGPRNWWVPRPQALRTHSP